MPERLQAILADPECYRGNSMREAKNLTEQLQSALKERIEAEQAQAWQIVSRLQERLHNMSEFSDTSEAQQKTLDVHFTEFERGLEGQTLIPVIRDAQWRFEQLTYPQVLSQMSSWARQAQAPHTPESVPEQPIEYVSSQSVQVNIDQAYLATEADVDEYLSRLKAAMLKIIQSGKRIQI
jgi:vacuolar-type H+-ATPase subunit I/STV1